MTVPSAAVVHSVEALPAPRGLKGRAYGDDALRHWRSSGRAEGQTTVASVDLRNWYRPERRRLSAVTDMDVSKLQSQSGYKFPGEKDTWMSGRQPRAEESALTADRTGNPAVIGFPLDRWLCGPFFRKVCLFQNESGSLHRSKVTVNCDRHKAADSVKSSPVWR